MSQSEDQDERPPKDEEYESDCEDLEDYKQDGYHPVYLGEAFMNGRFVVLQKLGWGHFSTVWLAEDKHFGLPGSPSTTRYVALKIQKSKESYSEAAQDEIHILKTLREAKNKPEWTVMRQEMQSKGLTLCEEDTYCIEILNNFPHFGMHGKHACSTFHIMGPNLLDIIRYFEKKHRRGVPLKIVKRITRQLLIGLDFMHRIGQVIHTDLKPENVMIDLPADNVETFINELKQVSRKPLSMKFLKMVVQNNSSKNKKKKKKKKTEDKQDAPQSEQEQIATTKNSVCSMDESVKSAPVYHTNTIHEAYETIDIGSKDALKKNDGSLATEVTANSNSQFQEELLLDPQQELGIEIEAFNQNEHDRVHQKEQIFNELEIREDCKQQQLVEDESSEPFHHVQQKDVSVEVIESQSPFENQELKKVDVIQGNFSEDEEDEDGNEDKNGAEGSEEVSGSFNSSQREPEEEQSEYLFYWKDKVKVVLNDNINIKIVDFGNACWTFKHFTENIQTREYRSPEAILGSKYDANTDIWSLACLVFELITGDYLFRPQSDREEPRDELHIALFISTLGKMPKKVSLDGKFARELFNKNGQLRHASIPQDYQLDEILIKEYEFSPEEALKIKDFLTPMLRYEIDKRITAREALNHPWLWS